MLRIRVRQSPWMSNHFDLRHQFQKKDTGLTGRVSVRDFQDVLEGIGVNVLVSELALLGGRLDADHVGNLDYYKFCRLMELDASEMYTSACAFMRGSRDAFVLLTQCVGATGLKCRLPFSQP